VQGIVVPASARTVYTSGVLGRDASGQLVDKSDVAAQSRQCLENIRQIIEAAGGSLHDLVKLTVFVSHPRHYEAMNAVRKEMLAGIAFTSTAVVAQMIDPHGLVEMEAVAVIGR
jgi:2-iminobutanoate/2-iminopropanoate deaminase